jgi:metal-dependent amidase/aminoacylase/carboxypeptidase family protein
MAPETITQKVSTDFANLSQEIPGVSFFFKAVREHVSLHSKEFEQAAGESFAFEQAMLAAQVIACTALEYFTNETFRIAVKADFEQRKFQIK